MNNIHDTTQIAASEVAPARQTKPSMGSVAMSMLAMLLASPAAFAQFGDLGEGLMEAFCEFIDSPIITVIIAVGIVSLLFLMALNEDNGVVSKIIKVLVAGMAIVFVGSLLSVLGLPSPTC